MNTLTYQKPLEWYIAKIDYLYSGLSECPDIRMGQHSNHPVLRLRNENGKNIEISQASKLWDHYYQLTIQRDSLITSIKALENELFAIYHTTYEKERPRFKILRNETTNFDIDFYNHLLDEACTFPKSNQLVFDGHNFRSRFEMTVAQEIKALGIAYKYDSGVQLSNRTIYPDFALAFPEFNRCIFFEIFGLLNDPKYVNDNIEKIRDYSNNGLILDNDIFTLGSSGNSMPNNARIRQKIVSIIGALCAMYVIPIN